MYVAQSIVFAIGISIFVTLFGLNFSDELLRIMGSSEQSITLTREYLRYNIFWSYNRFSSIIIEWNS